ncbi:hypothetical protein [Sedimentitalea todarodis]|uniref:DUF485 domain-containing protein n=1 Tax=Sedimentitalea todarodis TaxID=1631240 RepID=A0ABU3VLA9_9RHOB|nr:hypothetical protein [Sedimentitalea todarodis]MDU9006961.1 hypothetical protein [Sedimentitalea todarodis]
MPDYSEIEDKVSREEAFKNRILIIIFLCLFFVGFFLLGVGAYITITEIQIGMEGGVEKYIFVASGVTVILFGAQLVVLQITRKRYKDDYESSQ